MVDNLEIYEKKDFFSWALVIYVFYIIGIFSAGIFIIIGLIMAYIIKDKSIDTIYYSHFKYLINTFWIVIGLIVSLIVLFAIFSTYVYMNPVTYNNGQLYLADNSLLNIIIFYSFVILISVLALAVIFVKYFRLIKGIIRLLKKEEV